MQKKSVLSKAKEKLLPDCSEQRKNTPKVPGIAWSLIQPRDTRPDFILWANIYWVPLCTKHYDKHSRWKVDMKGHTLVEVTVQVGTQALSLC